MLESLSEESSLSSEDASPEEEEPPPLLDFFTAVSVISASIWLYSASSALTALIWNFPMSVTVTAPFASTVAGPLTTDHVIAPSPEPPEVCSVKLLPF